MRCICVFFPGVYEWLVCFDRASTPLQSMNALRDGIYLYPPLLRSMLC